MKLSLIYRFIYLIFALLFLLSVLIIYFIEIPDSSRLVNHSELENCKIYDSESIIDVSKPLSVAVWNIYKLQRKGWDKEIQKLKNNNEIILLQEAVSSKKLLDLFKSTGWYAEQAYAFAVSNEIAGVMTLSQPAPSKVCVFRQNEPLLRLPKTSLVSLYSLSNGKKLAVINIHSINFTLDLQLYKEQVAKIVASLNDFSDPIIFAGDFNTWHKDRLLILKEAFIKINLAEVDFLTDERFAIFGKPLDHIFYRGLVLKSARSHSTNTSDHAWLEASFNFE